MIIQMDIILREYANTGDGELTSIKVLEVINNTGKSLNEISSIMNKYPQLLVNIDKDSNKKEEIMNNKLVNNKIREIEDSLGDDYRILVRASGTESLIRVMMEGKDKRILESNIDIIKEVILVNI